MKQILIHKPLLPQLNEAHAEALYRQADKSFWPIVGTANHVAMQSVLDCYDMMESEHLLVYQVKKYMNQAAKEYDKYLSRVQSYLLAGFPLWNDLTRLSAAKMQPHVDHLHEVVKAFFSAHGIDKTELRATICTTDALIGISCAIFDALLAQFQKQTVYNITSSFRAGRMTGVQHAFSMVAKTYLRTTVPEVLDVNKDAGCMSALTAIMDCYQNYEFINVSAREALRLNPQMAKYAKEDEQHFFES